MAYIVGITVFLIAAKIKPERKTPAFTFSQSLITVLPARNQ